MAYSTNVTLSTSVRTNLRALQNTQSAVDVTNNRLNTGKKVSTVVDDAVAFFSAKALDDRAADFDNRKANIDQSISAINTALNATQAVDSLIKQLKGIATSAKSATAIERGTLQTQYNTVKSQIDQIVADSSYQGLNLVNNSTARQTTQFSDRSASRLDVTAQRLTTYTTGLASQTGSTVNSQATALSIATGSVVQFNLGAAGQYFVAGVFSANNSTTTLTLVRYGATSNVANLTSLNIATASTTTSTTFATSTASALLREYNVASGLNIFNASALYIFVDAALTGSFAVSTISTGTAWSAAAFDPSTGLANDSFTQALDFVIQGLDNAISQNNSVAKALGTNVAILSTRLEFTKEYVNNQKDGAGKLTLADTNEEGANLVSLQTRQQLGIQALSFAGQSEQSVLRLFG
jgi:flagellin-like hook-associated protein FlgL